MDVLVGLVTVAVLFLAFANGSNDNFKGVATLYGSGMEATGIDHSRVDRLHLRHRSRSPLGAMARPGLSAWVTTLPLAAVLSAVLYFALHHL